MSREPSISELLRRAGYGHHRIDGQGYGVHRIFWLAEPSSTVGYMTAADAVDFLKTLEGR